MDCMNCVETSARLHLYLDRELSIEEIEVVQQHLESCPGCECRFHFDMHIKRLIHERCVLVQAPEHLRQAILRLAHSRPGETPLDPELEKKIRAEIEGHH